MKAKERSGWIRVFASSTLLLTFLSAAYGQTQINLGSQGRNVDFTNAPFTRPIKSGSSLPAQCNSADFFFNTSATPGQNLFACLGGTWTAMAAAQSGLADPGANGLVKRTGTNTTTSVPAPLGTVVGTSDVQTLTGKSIDASEVNSGVLSPGRMPAFTGDVTTPTGSTAAALATVLNTPGTYGDATHALQLTVDSKGRVISLSALPITGGGTNGSSNSVTALMSGGLSGIPSTCSAGAMYLSTDQPLGQQIYVCSTANTWTPSISLGNSGALAFVNGALDIVGSVVPELSAANHFTGSNQLDGTTTLANVTVTGTCTGCNSSGFANPMTAVGDQIVGGASGAPTRAPIGAAGQVWTVNSGGQPVWASLPVTTPAASYASLSQDANGVLNISNSAGQGTSIAEHGVAGQGLSHTFDLSAAGGLSYLQYWDAGDLGYGIFLQSGVNKTFERYHPQSGAFFTDLGIQLNTSGTQPVCDGNHRGEFWFVQAATGVEDGLQVCHQTTTGFAWKVVF